MKRIQFRTVQNQTRISLGIAKLAFLLSFAMGTALWTNGLPLSIAGASVAASIIGFLCLSLVPSGPLLPTPPAPSMPDRTSAQHWLDDHLAQRSEASRLAVLAVSVDPPDATMSTSLAEWEESVREGVSHSLRSLLREGDLLAKGDVTDFLVCLSRVRAPQTDTLYQLARRLQKEVRPTIDSAGRIMRPKLTIGMSSSRLSNTLHGSTLLEDAEDAHEDATSKGSGSLSVSGAPAFLTSADTNLLSEVASALENGQITAWYQPQLEADTGEISGFEALARWEHPTRGVISPASFLPLIETSGLNRRLSQVIMTHALSALRTWDRAGLEIPGVGVNFSADELRDPDLSDYLKWELDRFDLKPERLVLEVLETVIAESHDDTVARNLRAASAMGCRIDLDDFGTGFTSIINIRRFDVSRIKIDRKLVTGAGNDPRQRELISALLAMSEHLNVATLGEGVETTEEQLALAQLGCGHVQGFAIARPMPLGDTLAWSQDHRIRIAEAKALAARSAKTHLRPR